MDSDTTAKPHLRAHLLQKGIALADSHPNIRSDLISIFSSLEAFQKGVQDCKSNSEALKKLQEFLEGTEFFEKTAFYLVNDEMDFELHFDADESSRKALEDFIRVQIRSGQFAWALQQNQAIFLDGPDGLPTRRVVLHGMSTRLSTLGVFVGFFQPEQMSLKRVVSHLLSVMVDATVFVLENQRLQEDMRNHNQMLESTVEERTHELRHTNQTLHHSNKELKRLNEKKSEFLGIAAHDLKNPLSGIIGLAQVIEMSIPDGSQKIDKLNHFELIGQIRHSAEHMIEIINDLLNSEALSSGNLKINPVPNDLVKVTQKVVALNQLRASDKSIEIHVNQQHEVRILADTIKIHEVIDNLVSNAIKYSPFGTRVDVEVKTISEGSKEWAQFSIFDQGPGLTDDDLSKVFGRFVKLSAQPTGGETSTGLGLSIAKTIIEMHSGKIWAERKAGGGSAFHFRLPASPVNFL
ncbi:MAG: HAMP domain-containing histidine kinase [Opitutales bacterium]|nr:HAMP domain-containing histidine kinase [Opitutales bacterium]